MWQTFAAGALFSGLDYCQTKFSDASSSGTSPGGCIVLLGYWRSGTTLLHNYLAHDKRFGYPSTYACMHPHHFIFTQAAALAKRQSGIRRPMDDVQIVASSPQEDEFALLGLGARSPYEALVTPRNLAPALALGDPRDLAPDEERRWEGSFNRFISGVSAVEGNRPLILKSPPHGYRVATLRRLLPDTRFIVIVRSPDTVFESVVRMWHSLFLIYALSAIPSEDDTRRVILADRLRFETKLTDGLAGLPENRVAHVHYESLVRNPIQSISGIYDQLALGSFKEVEQVLKTEVASTLQYSARNALPSDFWRQQVREHWRPIFERYKYDLS